MIAEALIAFAGGALTLVSPCSALLVPAFFAYAFASPGRLVARTGIFLAGLLTVLVPLGLGIGALGSLVLTRRAEVSAVAGLLLVVIGLYQLVVGGFSVPLTGRLERARAGRSSDAVLSTYLLGAVYAVGGFCAGPILGGVPTIYGELVVLRLAGRLDPFLLALEHVAVSLAMAAPLVAILHRVGQRAAIVIGLLYGGLAWLIVNSLALPAIFGQPTPRQIGPSAIWGSLTVHLVFGLVVALVSPRLAAAPRRSPA